MHEEYRRRRPPLQPQVVRAAGAAAPVAAAALAGGAAFAAEGRAAARLRARRQDPPPLLRRISGLHTERWQDHFSSIANDAILVNVNDRVLHYWGVGRLLPHLPDLGAADRGDDPARPHHGHAEAPRPRLAADRGDAQAPPRPADLRAAGAGQPARHPRAEPRLAGLPHPRHQRHPQDRPAVVVAAASASSTSTSSRSTTAPRSARRCC